MKILYLGDTEGTSRDRARALERLGHEVRHLAPRRLLPPSRWIDRLIWRVGAAVLERWVRAGLARELGDARFDLAYVDNGECITPALVADLRRRCGRVVNYAIDDPFGPRDLRRFSAYRACVPHYDLLVVCRAPNVEEARRRGARHVMLVHRSADELSHAPQPMDAGERKRWAAEVLFLGTWMPERGPFMAELLRRGVPLSIRGGRWEQAPEWPQIRAAWRGGPLHGSDYAHAIQGARISLGLLSRGNRDLHTTRSLEIPALAGLLCAERTSEHLAMYREGLEAVFWRDAAECAERCKALLADEPRRAAIAAAGRRRLAANGHYNEPTLARILDVACSVGLPQAA